MKRLFHVIDFRLARGRAERVARVFLRLFSSAKEKRAMDGHLDTLRGKRIRRRFEQSRLEPQMTALAYKVAWPLTRLRLEPADGEASAPQAPGQAANRARQQAAGA